MNNTTSPSTSSNHNTTTKSYSAALTFPRKDQAIIFNSIDGVKLQEYLLQLGPIIQPKNIIFSSRISNNRICIYLSSKDVVDNFLGNNGQININGEIIKARRLITPSDRLVMSNVSPTIPHEILINELEKLGLKLISPVTFLRIGAPLPEYSHILSFRRQVHIIPTENLQLPESMEITHDDVNYRIFLTRDSQVCFKCKLSGHIASQCTTTISLTNQNAVSVVHELDTPENRSTGQIVKPNNETDTNSESMELNTESTQSSKRNISEVLTPTAEEPPEQEKEEANMFVLPPNKQKLKKYKSDDPKQSQKPESIVPLTTFVDHHSPPFVLTSKQLLDLFENTHGSQDCLSIAKDYTDDIPSLIQMLTEIHPHIKDRSLKIRCTKLGKKLSKQMDSETYEPSEGDSSDQQY